MYTVTLNIGVYMNLTSYQEFVESVTSAESNDVDVFVQRINELNQLPNINPALLLTAATGLAAEGGEFAEIPKKIIFQGKAFDEDARFHMKRELGDVMWYWINACRALNYDPNEIIKENVLKLEKRYPGGKFDTWFSENRKDGDL
jgi:NTP pyrophosphatase (non-canonical NTP hydrolase)